jgi:hypothetical protein
MGFSGGGSNVTKPHTHDGAVVQDGGSLAANATQFGLTNGSLLYSDGTNIQELGVGASGYVLGTAAGTIPTWEANAAAIVMNVNGQMVYFDGSRTALDIGSQDDVLTVSAGGLPTWAAPAAGGAWTVIAEQTVAGTTIDTTSLSDCDNYQILDFWAACTVDAAGTAAELQLYDSNDVLKTDAYYMATGYAFGSFGSAQLSTSYEMTLGNATSNQDIFFHATIFNRGMAGDNGMGYITFNDRNNGGAAIGTSYKNAGAGQTIRGFKLIEPTTTRGIANSYWTLLGA